MNVYRTSATQWLSMLGIAMAVAGCVDETPLQVQQPEPSFSALTSTSAAGLQVVSGDGQIGLINEVLPNPLVVRVVDADGVPVAGRTVSWRAASGSGVTLGSTSTSNAQGLAQINWRLGSAAGTVSAEAYIYVGSQTVKAPFTATALAAGQTRSWTGSVSSDWKDQRNWEPEGVPTSKDSVVIPAAQRFPVVGSNVTIGRLAVESAARVEVGAGAALAVSTDLLADGPVTGTGKVQINGKGGMLRGKLATLEIVQGSVVPNVTLNGALTVAGNLTVSAPLTLNGQRADVHGDLLVPVSNGRLKMTNAADSLTVHGSASFHAGGGNGYLTAGVLRIAGDMSQRGTASFVATGTHTTELIGTTQQVVNFEYGRMQSNRFFNLVVQNPAGFRILKDVAVGGSLRSPGTGPVQGPDTLVVAQDVVIGGRAELMGLSVGKILKANASDYAVTTTIFTGLNQQIPVLPYHNLTVSGYGGSAAVTAAAPLQIGGNLQTYIGALTTAPGGITTVGGQLNIGNGSYLRLGGPLEVTGSAAIAGSSAYVLVNGQSLRIGGDLSATAQQSLRMLNTADRVTVDGNATFTNDNRNALKAGILYLRGDLTQRGNIWSFPSEGTHQVVLDGAAPQTVSFADTTGYSYFNRLQISNKLGVTMSTPTRVRHTLDLTGQATVPAGASLKVIGYSYYINGRQAYQSATLNLFGGSVLNNHGTTRADILNQDPAATVNGNPVTR